VNLIGQYKNGNYTVSIYDDGTKIRENDLDFFEPAFPESMDIKITNACDMMCPFCHEASTPNGKHGDILHLPFIDTLHPYTELAIGGGNPLSQPDMIPFLTRLKERKLIPSMTVNQVHFLKNVELLRDLSERKLIYGLGVSYISGSTSEDRQLLIENMKGIPNAVLHIINGVVPFQELEELAHHGFKILILGYKDFRRGSANLKDNRDSIHSNQQALFVALPYIISNQWFSCVSFDNLAIRQLDVRQLMSEQEWRQFYMGDDGGFTMYVDAVNREYAVCSVSENRHKLTDDSGEMFQIVQSEVKK